MAHLPVGAFHETLFEVGVSAGISLAVPGVLAPEDGAGVFPREAFPPLSLGGLIWPPI